MVLRIDSAALLGVAALRMTFVSTPLERLSGNIADVESAYDRRVVGSDPSMRRRLLIWMATAVVEGDANGDLVSLEILDASRRV